MFNIPNFLTLSNLICGCLALSALYAHDTKMMLIFFMGALLFDLLDGLAARALHQTSEIGAELDSLADMISFGVLPGFLLYDLIGDVSGIDSTGLFPAALGFLYTAAAALRLAKFNTDDRQTTDFMGLNTPAASIAIVGLFINANFCSCPDFIELMAAKTAFIITVMLVLSALLLVDLPMLSFKFKRTEKKRSVNQIILIAGGVIITFLLRTCALPFLILWYILFSIIQFTIDKSK